MYSIKEYYFFCNFSSFPITKLTGLPSSTVLDQFYYPNVHLRSLSWLGFNGTSVTYNQSSWRGKTLNSSVCIESNATEDRLLLGRNVWEIKTAGSSNKDKLYYNLSMHPCLPEEFVCNDGSCTLDEKRCDGAYDCTDNSDEVDCKFILFTNDYDKEVIVPLWSDKKLKLKLNLHLQEVLDIKINDGKIDLKLNVTAIWLDQRLSYIYVNEDIRLNILSSNEFDSVWKPKFIYENKDTSPYFVNVEPAISVSLEQPMSTESFVDEISEATTRKYYGELNPLHWSTVIRSNKYYFCELR
jgi:hypothetical protein